MIADAQVLRRLEWARVQATLSSHARTPMGAERLARLVPGAEREEVERDLERVADMRTLHGAEGRLPISEVADPARVLEALGVRGRTLPGREIFETVHLLVVAREVAAALRALDPEEYAALGAEWARFPELEALIGVIHGNLTPSGEVEDHASPELTRIRREIRALSEALRERLDAILRAEAEGPVLRDTYVTIRNERFVVPIRVDSPRRFPGIVHGRSASEQTLFVEPMETVETNNRLVALREEESAEVERILRAYTEHLRRHREEIGVTASVLGEVDALEAVSEWAELTGATRPALVESGGLRLVGARHPLLEETLRRADPPRRLVPLDVDLPRELNALVISGPNAGGKTVALKTIGLLALMAHAGLPVPADDARFPWFGRVFADIGDEQSIEGSLSTFASHVRNLAAMVKEAEAPGLVLIDEIGTGTDPAEGAALGIAVLERLRASGAHVVATTHHQGVKTWAYRSRGCLNAACAFDESTLRPTYRLVAGVAGSSIGLTMAEQLGMDAEVVEDARRRLDPSGAEATRALDSVRALAEELEERRAEAAEETRRLRARVAELEAEEQRAEERREREWERKVEELVASFRRDAERAIRKIDERRTQQKLDLERARRERELRERYSEQTRAERVLTPPPAAWEPKEGERVLATSLRREGVVKGVRGSKVDVQLGRSVFTVPRSDLRPSGSAAGEGSKAESRAEDKSATRARRPSLPRGVDASLDERSVSPELQLIGMRVDEALAALERYLDDAALAGFNEVRLVHGFGTGRLRDAVRAELSKHPFVSRWREAGPEEGGGGATVALLEEER